MRQKITTRELIVEASGEYLTDFLPNDYHKLSHTELMEFVADNLCAMYEATDPEAVWEFIESSAYSMERFLRSKGIKVKENWNGSRI